MPACISSIFLRVTLTVVSQSMCVATVCCTGAARTRTKPKKPGTYVDRKYRVLFESRGLDLNQRPSAYDGVSRLGRRCPGVAPVGRIRSCAGAEFHGLVCDHPTWHRICCTGAASRGGLAAIASWMSPMTSCVLRWQGQTARVAPVSFISFLAFDSQFAYARKVRG